MLIKSGETKPCIEMQPVVGGAVLWIQVQGNVEAIAAEINKTIGDAKWELKLSKVKKKRSLDANAYAWVLLDKLAEVLKQSPKDVYREMIRDIPGVSKILCAQQETVEDFTRIWESNGIGWSVEPFPSKIPGCVNLKCYFGSSCYDTTQMSALIDRIIEECKLQGIPTMTPKEIAELEGIRNAAKQ